MRWLQAETDRLMMNVFPSGRASNTLPTGSCDPRVVTLFRWIGEPVLAALWMI
jgi:hypothetical protein